MSNEIFNIPNNGKVVESDWTNFQLVGGNEKGEREYNRDRRFGQLAKNRVLIEKSKVENATTNYKEKKIGRKVGIIAFYKPEDKLAA